MVKLTTQYLFRKISKKNTVQRRKKGETDHDFLNRVTHLHLKSQFIDKIAAIPECPLVSVVYLQNNLLQNLQNLENFPNLTHLHLQHNYISKIENLSELKLLKKLYLGYNEISVVEGLEGLEQLTELHLECQRLPEGETLYFDPYSVSHLGNSLKELNVSCNNMTSMRSLSPLFSLSKLVIEDNKISDINDVVDTLKELPKLETLNSEGNPVARDRKFLDHVVVASESLKTLNGKDIDEQTRVFITNLTYSKEIRKKTSKQSAQPFDSDESFRDGGHEFRETPSKLSPSIGSRLFPLLKKMSLDEQRNSKTSATSSKAHSLALQNSCKVSRLLGSASYYY